MSYPSLGSSYWPLVEPPCSRGGKMMGGGEMSRGNNRWAHGCWNTAHERGHPSFIEYGQLLDCQHHHPQHHIPSAALCLCPSHPHDSRDPPAAGADDACQQRDRVSAGSNSRPACVTHAHTLTSFTNVHDHVHTHDTHTDTKPCMTIMLSWLLLGFFLTTRCCFVITLVRIYFLVSKFCEMPWNAVNKNKLCRNEWYCFTHLTPLLIQIIRSKLSQHLKAAFNQTMLVLRRFHTDYHLDLFLSEEMQEDVVS